MNKISKNKLGFTLIELLVAVAIIAILTGLIMASLASSRAKARDAKRISDVAQLQLALEQYFSKNNVYPDLNNYATALVPTYISALPRDPLTNTSAPYVYAPDPDQNYYHYILKITLENSYTEGLSGNQLGYPCDPLNKHADETGYVGYVYCVGPK